MRRFLPRSSGLVVATILSIAAHAAVLHWLSEKLPPAGEVEGPAPAMLEIVLENASQDAVTPISPVEASSAVAPNTNDQEVTAARAVEPVANLEQVSPVPDTAPVQPVQPARSLARAPVLAEETTPAAPQQTESVKPVPEEEAFVLLPRENAPVPTARPTPPKPKPVQNANQSRETKKVRTKTTPPKKAEARKAQPRRNKPSAGSAARNTRKAAPSSTPRQAAREASPAAKASYAKKLLRHVERRKRYPRAAAGKRISGATRLAITINRSGSLVGARVTGSSGHRVLDDAAVATARRAAPYPRPPQGVGGSTISFSVTLRFKP